MTRRWTSELQPDGSMRYERADGRVIVARDRAVTAMTPERLAELRAYADDLRPLADRADAAAAVVELLAEVDRLRATIDSAETALGRAWMHGGATLAQGVARKTAAMERLAR